MADLEKIALQLGADVPFFLRGGCALMEGIGEKLTPLPVQKGWAVLICPPYHANTAEVFHAFDQTAPIRKSPSASADLITALETGKIKSIGSLLQNNLLSVSNNSLFNPEQAIKVILGHGAIGASMSGSGSTVFGLFTGKKQAQDARSKIAEELDDDFMIYAVPLIAESFMLLPPAAKGTY